MKDGLIRLTDEKDIFYDSIERVYRYRQHCPQCNTVLKNCICYNDLDLLLNDIDDGISDYTCSSKCALLIGDFDELNEAMQEVGLEKDIKTALKELTDTQRVEHIQCYQIEDVFVVLFSQGSSIPINHLKDPSTEEQIEIIMAMGDAKDVLYNNEIDIHPEIEDLTEEQASQVLTILTEDGGFDAPHGDYCNT